MSRLAEKIDEYQLELGQLHAKRQTYLRAADEITRKIDILDAKMAGFREALDLLSGDPVEAAKGEEVPLQLPSPRRRTRRLSDQWQLIISRATRDQTEFSYSDLEEAAHSINHEVSRETLRSQMSLYKGVGIVEAVGEGTFRLTTRGRQAAGITEASASNETGAAKAAPEDGVSAPSDDHNL